MNFHKAAAFVLLTLPAALSAGPRADGDVQALAARSFAPLMEEYRVPGLAVGITFGGESYFYSAGQASREGGTAAGPDTLFELGSVSKLFTAGLAALAEERGKLDLTAPVADALPELSGRAFGALPLSSLASHHSGGLPLQVPDSAGSTKALVSWLADWQAEFPGARSYSNISIGLLGHVTAAALGKSYSAALEQELLAPLGLASTWVDVPRGGMHRYAYGYDRKTDQPIRVNPGVLADEAYGVKSSARDLVRFLDLHLGHADAAPEMRRALERTRQGLGRTEAYVQNMVWEQYPWPVGVERMIKGNSYAYILEPQPMEAITPPLPPQRDVILNKTGATNGFSSYAVLLPGADLGVVVLANRNIPNEARIRAVYGFVESLLAGVSG